MLNFVLKPRATDYVLGSTSPIPFTPVNPSGIWIDRLEFFESQDIAFETEGCVLFTAQESFDAQMDLLISNGTISSALVAQFRSMGYMDLGKDGLAHFHSSPRYLQIKTGNGYNGNSAPEAWDAIRTWGVLPWTDLPLDKTITQAEYLIGVTSAMDAKAGQFLALIGGKQAVQYHWIQQGYPEKIAPMATALQQAPLCLGIATNAGWNQVTPQPPELTQTPNHAVLSFEVVGNGNLILDHYQPYLKTLTGTYPIPYVMQGIVTPIFTSPLPSLPPNPTVQQESSWLTSVSQWLSNLINQLKGRQNLSSNQMINYSIFKSRTFWTIVVAFLYNIWQLFEPSVAPTVSATLDVVFASLANYFHVQGVQNAAVSSATLGKAVSGQN